MRNIVFFSLMVFSCEMIIAQGAIKGSDSLKTNVNSNIYEEKSCKKDLWGLDLFPIGISAHYAYMVNNQIGLGAEIGVGNNKCLWVLLAGKHFTEENTVWTDDASQAHLHLLSQRLFAHLFVRWKPKADWVELDIGFRAAGYKRLIPSVDFYGYPRFLGFYFKPSVGYKRIKLGVRLEVGDMLQKEYKRTQEVVVIASPFIKYSFD